MYRIAHVSSSISYDVKSFVNAAIEVKYNESTRRACFCNMNDERVARSSPAKPSPKVTRATTSYCIQISVDMQKKTMLWSVSHSTHLSGVSSVNALEGNPLLAIRKR